jgi:Chaperone of endosialidase
MNTIYSSFLGLIGALALAGTAFAQVPSSNDTSTTDGNFNTGMGTGALGGPTPVITGSNNTASGYQALYNTTTGSNNTASGYSALLLNTTGHENTASGYQALNQNSTGTSNTASGVNALYSNTTGSDNTAFGFDALFSNTTGSSNTASGYAALHSNTTGNQNTASGVDTLQNNTDGSNNTASGVDSLRANTTGSSNIAVGFEAGSNLTTGSNNIDVGNVGVAGESNTIRIGTHGTQRATFIAGIYGASVTGSTVMVTPAGKLGVATSSERFKTAIAPMGANTAKLGQLRPVTFHLKTDPHGALQYGLIAEEVAKVYPELVIRDESGRVDGVRYDELAPMLLNEVQQQAAVIRELKAQQIATRGEQLRMQQQVADLEALNRATQVALFKLQAQNQLVAKR